MFDFRRQPITVPDFPKSNAADWLPTEVEYFRRRGRLVDITSEYRAGFRQI